MRPLPAILVGVLIGAGTTWWFFRSEHLSSISHQTISPDSSLETGDSPLLILPPKLDSAEASQAIRHWLDTRTDSSSERVLALRALLTLLPGDSYPELMAALLQSDAPDIAHLRQIVFDTWVILTPETAARWMVSAELSNTFDAPARTGFCLQAIQAWSQLDFDAAYAWASSLPPDGDGPTMVTRLLAELIKTNPSRALELAQTQGTDFLNAHQGALILAWAEIDPAATVRHFAPMMDLGGPHSWELDRAIQLWIASDPSESLHWVLDQQDLNENQIADYIFQSSGKSRDYHGLADALTQLGDTTLTTKYTKRILTNWMRTDARAAATWLKGIPDIAIRTELVEQQLYFFQDKESASILLELVQGIPSTKLRDASLSHFFTDWAQKDPESAIEWLKDKNDPSIKALAGEVEATLLGSLARTDLDSALKRWEELPEGSSKQSSVFEIAHNWAGSDPASAARWLSLHLPTEDVTKKSPSISQYFIEQGIRDGVLYSRTGDPQEDLKRTLLDLVPKWSSQDPEGALKWAESLPAGQAQKVALLALSDSSSSVADPAWKADLFTHISDPDLRHETLKSQLFQWLQSDTDSARDWIESHDVLPEEEVAQIYLDIEKYTGLKIRQ